MKKNKKIVSVLSTAAFMTLTMASMAFAAQPGWVQEDGEWYFYKNSEDYVENTWKQSGDYWFYLGDDGAMVTESFIEDDGNYYYVNGDGVMSVNQWRYIETDDTDGESRWYYFGSNGKAYKAKSTSNSATLREINGKNYIFDEYGIMQYGWVNEDGKMIDEDDEDGWKDAVYYCGDEQDGAVADGWRALDVDNDDDEDYPGYYWFYFKSNGKKTVSVDDKEINGAKYGFDENGVMLYEFSEVSEVATGSNAVTAYKYYNDFDNGTRKSGWFKAVPSEDINPDGYDEGEEKWFYANSNGTLKASTLATINSKKYAFNEYGEMLYGLVGLELDGNTIVSYTDMIETEDDLLAVDGTDYVVYYFGDEDDGAMKKSSTSIKVDGESYKYEFKSTGEGREGIYKDVIYIKGRRVEADTDQGYIMVTADGEETSTIGEGYLINTSGKIQKNKKNVKDKDDMYYCTDSDGIVTYIGSEKYVAE